MNNTSRIGPIVLAIVGILSFIFLGFGMGYKSELGILGYICGIVVFSAAIYWNYSITKKEIEFKSNVSSPK